MNVIIKLIKQLINRWFKPKVLEVPQDTYDLNRHTRRYLAYRIREHTPSHLWLRCTHIAQQPNIVDLECLSRLSGMTVEDILAYE